MKRKVTLLYRAINSQKLDVVDRLFHKYAGQEIELMNVVTEKYKTDPYSLPFTQDDLSTFPPLPKPVEPSSNQNSSSSSSIPPPPLTISQIKSPPTISISLSSTTGSSTSTNTLNRVNSNKIQQQAVSKSPLSPKHSIVDNSKYIPKEMLSNISNTFKSLTESMDRISQNKGVVVNRLKSVQISISEEVYIIYIIFFYFFNNFLGTTLEELQ